MENPSAINYGWFIPLIALAFAIRVISEIQGSKRKSKRRKTTQENNTHTQSPLIMGVTLLTVGIFYFHPRLALIAAIPWVILLIAKKVYGEGDQLLKNTNDTELTQERVSTLEWDAFEEFCVEWLIAQGIPVRRSLTQTGWGADGGVDIEPADPNKIAISAPSSLKVYAQCKAWNKPVGVKEIREFAGALVLKKNGYKAFFFSSSTFTEDARALAKEVNITLTSGDDLVKKFNTFREEQKRYTLKKIYNGRETIPACTNCKCKMVARQGNTQFWGCPNYPKCKSKLKLKGN